MKKRGFSPVLDENTEILVLGSLPSDESIRKQQYYGNPGNDFWRLEITARTAHNKSTTETREMTSGGCSGELLRKPCRKWTMKLGLRP